MKMKNIILLTILCTICTYIGYISLHQYRIHNFYEAKLIVLNTFHMLFQMTPLNLNVCTLFLITLLGFVLSIYTLLNLMQHSFHELEYKMKIFIITMVSILIANILISFYTLLFAILMLIVLIAFIAFFMFFISAGPITSNGGPVYVKSYRRKNGTTVKNHVRRRPRR